MTASDVRPPQEKQILTFFDSAVYEPRWFMQSVHMNPAEASVRLAFVRNLQSLKHDRFVVIVTVMWNLSIPWWEFILRGLIVYVFLIVLLRITGKRQVGQLAPFDLVLLLVLSNAVQNSMNGGDNSLVGGLISATTLVLLNYGVGLLAFRNKRLERLIEGRPEVLIHNGKLFEDVMSRAQLTHHELNAALRQAGVACIEDVRSAVLENNGAISVLPRSRDSTSVS